MKPTRTPKLAPYIVAEDAFGLIRFIQEGIGGKLSYEVKDGEGDLAHAEIRIADSLVMLGGAARADRRFPAMVHLYVPDAGTAYRRAIKAGASSLRKPTKGPDGDVRGGVRDAWGNQWWFTAARKSS